jgi:hypothetical protein
VVLLKDGGLGGPAVATGAATRGAWLEDRFMAGASEKGYRVDFIITLHWYGGDFRTPQAVDPGGALSGGARCPSPAGTGPLRPHAYGAPPAAWRSLPT